LTYQVSKLGELCALPQLYIVYVSRAVNRGAPPVDSADASRR
jgi:hypothetical protein